MGSIGGNSDMLKKYTEIVACPDCKEKLQEIGINYQFFGFSCENCEIIFPIRDGIPILLGKRVRNYYLEHNLIDNIRQETANHSLGWLAKYIKKTQNLLTDAKNEASWEWEDEEHWGKTYSKESMAVVRKNWNDRIWQREFLVKHIVVQTSFGGKTILDVGCGEGQDFRLLLSRYCDETTLYVATDISLAGLKLNRARNTHKNSLYILCSADSLPVQKEAIDVICYFGILHHTEKKAATIPEDSKLLKRGGYILVHEPLWRPSPLLPSFLKPKTEQSAHEETIREHELLAQLGSEELKIIAARRMHTIFYQGMFYLFKNILINNKILFRFISNIDILLVKLVGPVIPFFKAGSTMLVLKKP